ncbi:MAG TPA: hypothetical protein VEU30_08510 [Thermoanaerobaculia bacterium]|nr:hypothetical protein [Thermoanaerobaculia bacterium]
MRTIAIDGTRRRLFVADAGRVFLAPLAAEGQRELVVELDSPCTSLHVTDDALVIGEENGTAWHRSVDRGESTLLFRHTAAILDCRPFAGGYAVLDGTLAAHVRTPAGMQSIAVEGPVFTIGAGESGVWLLAGFDLLHWNGTTTVTHPLLDPYLTEAQSGAMAFSPHCRALVSHWDDGRVIALPRVETVHVFPWTKQATAVAVSDDAARTLLGGFDGSLRVVDAGGRELFARTVAKSPIARLEIASDGVLAAFLAEDGAFGVLDTASGALLAV